MRGSRSFLLLLLLVTWASPVWAQPDLVLERVYPASDDTSYQYVPFSVPEGTARLQIRYSYQDLLGLPSGWLQEQVRSAVDIGIFDARGQEAEGFRGWSGGKRSEFFVGRRSATPGYLAGPLPAGRWHLALGLYRVAPGGVRVRIEVDFSDSEDEPSPRASEPRPSPPELATEPGWFKGDLHLHTVHSDGDRTMSELARELEGSGLDFAALTEHNTISHHTALPSTDRLLLLGEEITTFGGHCNVWGVPRGEWFDFRRPFEDLVAQAHRSSSLISINHPFALCKGCGWSHGYDQDFDALEVWNGPWDATDEMALKLWDRLLSEGRSITPIASSDSHKPSQPLGHPCTALEAEGLARESLLSALRTGKVVLLADPTLEPMKVTVSATAEQVAVTVEAKEAETLVLVHKLGRESHPFVSGRRLVLPHPAPRLGYLRVELRDGQGNVRQLSRAFPLRDTGTPTSL